MRFEQYLKESGKNLYEKSTKEMVEMIKKDCEYFLYQRPHYNSYYYRAMKKSEFGTIGISDVRRDRRPRNSPPTIHAWLDKYFKKRFGWSTRSEGLFVAGTENIANDYGSDIYIIFPIGKYRVVYDPKVEDIFQLMDGFAYDILGADPSSTIRIENALEDKEKYEAFFDALKNELDNHYNDDISGAFDHDIEFVIDCEKFYYIHINDYKQMGIEKEMLK